MQHTLLHRKHRHPEPWPRVIVSIQPCKLSILYADQQSRMWYTWRSFVTVKLCVSQLFICLMRSFTNSSLRKSCEGKIIRYNRGEPQRMKHSHTSSTSNQARDLLTAAFPPLSHATAAFQPLSRKSLPPTRLGNHASMPCNCNSLATRPHSIIITC